MSWRHLHLRSSSKRSGRTVSNSSSMRLSTLTMAVAQARICASPSSTPLTRAASPVRFHRQTLRCRTSIGYAEWWQNTLPPLPTEGRHPTEVAVRATFRNPMIRACRPPRIHAEMANPLLRDRPFPKGLGPLRRDGSVLFPTPREPESAFGHAEAHRDECGLSWPRPAERAALSEHA